MEQYEIAARCCGSNIRKILGSFKPYYIYIRWIGSMGGKVILSEEISGKDLTMEEAETGFEIKINGKKKFLFEFRVELADRSHWVWGKKWCVAYERIDSEGRMHNAHCGYPNCYEPYFGPDDPDLPSVINSLLRSANYTHLVEITFHEKIPIKRSYPFDKKNGIYYWTFDEKAVPRK